MNGKCDEVPVYRISTFRYMTYEEIARAVNCTPHRVQSLVRRSGWRVHLDRLGQRRARVPESVLDAAAPLAATQSASLEPASDLSSEARTNAVLSPISQSSWPQPRASGGRTRHVCLSSFDIVAPRDPEREGLVAVCSILCFSFSVLIALTMFAKALPGP